MSGTETWNGGPGNWDESADWSGGTVPNSGDVQVFISQPGGSDVTIAANESFQVSTLEVGVAQNGLSNQLLVPGQLSATGGTTIGPSGEIELEGGSISGPITVDAASSTNPQSGVLAGAGFIGGSVDDGGAIVADGDFQTSGGGNPSSMNALLIAGDLNGDGKLTLAGDGTIARVEGSISNTINVDFDGKDQSLIVSAGEASPITNEVSGFDRAGSGVGDLIVLAGQTASNLTLAYHPFLSDPGGFLDVSNMNGQLVAGIMLTDTGPDVEFSLTQESTGAAITEVVCYGPGTLIATPEGERPIESLAPGDPVLTMDGRILPVRWIGRRRVDCATAAQPDAAIPVVVRRGAFGGGLPRRDLVLSPQHAIHHDGALFPVACLVDGVSIVRKTDVRMQVYLHVELDTHEILLAEGLPAESYLDTGNRSMFANASLVRDDRGRAPIEPCAPMITSGPALEALRARIAEIARSATTLAA